MMGALFDDLGWDENARGNAIEKMTDGRTRNATEISGIEAGRAIKRLLEIKKAKDDTEAETPETKTETEIA